MNIIPLFCEIDDCFLVYEKQRFPTDLSEIPDVSKKTRTSAKSSYQRDDDDPHRLSAKSVSNVETLLSQARLPVLALGVSKPRQL